MRPINFSLLGALALAATLLLQGCGWHLRGATPLPAELQTLHLQIAGDEYSPFSRLLKRSFRAMNVTLTDTAQQAPYTLMVSGMKDHRRTLSTTSSAKVAEYALTTSLVYSINSAEGKQLVAPTTLSTERSYLYDRNNAIAAYEEQNLLREEMQRDLVQQLMRRYRAVQPTQPASATPATVE